MPSRRCSSPALRPPRRHRGTRNRAITGGAYNLADDLYTSITGGCSNFAGTGANPGYNSACVANVSKGYFASIGGGDGNTASGEDGSVLGGKDLSEGGVYGVSAGLSGAKTLRRPTYGTYVMYAMLNLVALERQRRPCQRP